MRGLEVVRWISYRNGPPLQEAVGHKAYTTEYLASICGKLPRDRPCRGLLPTVSANAKKYGNKQFIWRSLLRWSFHVQSAVSANLTEVLEYKRTVLHKLFHNSC